MTSPDASHDSSKPRQADGKAQAPQMLWDEYKLLQDKMDRASDLRFRVKQWAVTLTVAVFFGGAASRIPWWLALACGVLVILAFAAMELFHHFTHGALAARAKRIELLFARDFAPGRRPSIGGSTPAIAASIADGQRQIGSRYPRLSRIARQPSVVFYVLLALLSFLVAAWLASGPDSTPRLDVKLVDDSVMNVPRHAEGKSVPRQLSPSGPGGGAGLHGKDER